MHEATSFHESPILNSHYEVPSRHWVLDEGRQPTDTMGEGRRPVSFISPIPRPRKAGRGQRRLGFDVASEAPEAEDQQYELTALIDGLRREIARWRALPEAQWRVTPETARLLKHWRHHQFSGIHPFFCQVEAVETAIWLTEFAPAIGNRARGYLEQLQTASENANPGLSRPRQVTDLCFRLAGPPEYARRQLAEVALIDREPDPNEYDAVPGRGGMNPKELRK